MRKKIVILYDDDKDYINHFVSYFENYQDSLLRIIGFSEKIPLLEFMNQNNIALLLTNEDKLEDISIDFDRERIILFTEEADIKSINGIKVLYKFQQMENIIRYIINLYAEITSEKRDVIKIKKGEPTKVIGIYSPVKRCGKTALSMELAEQLTKRGKVLMMNMEEYSALRKNSEEDNVYDLADLLYFYLQNSWSFELKLKVVLQRLRGFDYIPPVRNGNELRNITIEQWKGLITKIAEVSDYKVIVLDLSDIISNILQLLYMCDCVIVPFMSDEISCEKMKNFQQDLSKDEGNENVQIYRLSMDGVVNETYNNQHLRENVNTLIEKGELPIADGEQQVY